ncbi:MAG: protein kinase [Nitrospira sp. CR2.1]|nr:protein kinase [Nitrospira sp. CR2.1]
MRIYDFGEAEASTFFIAMELVNGESLGTVLQREGALSIPRAITLTKEIGRALAAAHEAGVVHRDLKPDNVMVVWKANEAESVKVLDFGIAKAIQDRSRPADLSAADSTGIVTSAGAIVGTPRYMSPEQFLGLPVDARTDVYALALLAYEMLTGVLPFEATGAAGWAAAHVAGEPRPFDTTAAGAGVPAAVQSVILGALAKRPEQRPATMHDFLGALEPVSPRVAPTVVIAQRPLMSSYPALAPTVDDLSLSISPALEQPVTAQRRRLYIPLLLVALVVAGGSAAAATVVMSRGGSGDTDSVDGATNRACDRVAHSKTCAEASAAMKDCPESAGHAHEHAHVYRDSLCGE